MSLIQPLPPGPLDIVGDIHGELSALQDLLHHLGYDDSGRHPQARTLVFVGDFVDRGPDSPGVVDLVQRLVESGNACAIAGNHASRSASLPKCSIRFWACKIVIRLMPTAALA